MSVVRGQAWWQGDRMDCLPRVWGWIQLGRGWHTRAPVGWGWWARRKKQHHRVSEILLFSVIAGQRFQEVKHAFLCSHCYMEKTHEIVHIFPKAKFCFATNKIWAVIISYWASTSQLMPIQRCTGERPQQVVLLSCLMLRAQQLPALPLAWTPLSWPVATSGSSLVHSGPCLTSVEEHP